MNSKRPDSAPIRLQKVTEMPAQKHIIDMMHESKRSKMRVELPLHPKGRKEPAVLTVQYDEHTGKMSWMLYDGVSDEAEVIWGASDPDPTKIVQSMRDWAMTAKLTEGWTHNAEPVGAPTYAQQPPPPPYPAPFPTPVATFPTLPPGYATPAMPFPTMQYHPGYPPGYPAGYPPPYPQPPMTPDAAAPGHWVHAYQQPQGPLPPELWSTQPVVPQPPSVMLGDVLVAAGVIPSGTLHAALTLQNASQVDRRRIGEILVNSGAVPPPMLHNAVRLQQLARRGEIAAHRVTELLRRIHATGESIDEVLHSKSTSAAASAPTPAPTPAASSAKATGETAAKKQRPSDEILEREAQVTEEDQKKLRGVMALIKRIESDGEAGAQRADKLFDLLKQSGLLAQEAIDAAKASTKTSTDAMKALLIKESVDPQIFIAGLECTKLLESEQLQSHQAIIALGYCERSRVSLKEAIDDLGWDVDTSALES